MTKISIIVAIAENYAIGKNNRLLWHIPDDLKRFKKITTGHTIIMGKNTFLSLPAGPLPNRRNIVISDDKKDNFNGVVMAFSIEDAFAKCDTNYENFVIGGGMIYKQFLKYAEKLYLTKVNKSYDADTFFPEINFDEWEEVFNEKNSQELPEELDFTYLILSKKVNLGERNHI